LFVEHEIGLTGSATATDAVCFAKIFLCPSLDSQGFFFKLEGFDLFADGAFVSGAMAGWCG
jgi:hypothetical protein